MKKLDAAGQHSIVGTDQVKVPGFPSPLLLRPGAGVAREERRTVEELDGGRNGPRLGMSVTSHLRAQWATERRTGKAESEPRQAALRDRIGNSYPTAASLVIQSNSFRKRRYSRGRLPDLHSLSQRSSRYCYPQQQTRHPPLLWKGRSRSPRQIPTQLLTNAAWKPSRESD